MFGLGTLARVAREVREDLTAAQDRDPAARSVGRLEILLTYGGVQALWPTGWPTRCTRRACRWPLAWWPTPAGWGPVWRSIPPPRSANRVHRPRGRGGDRGDREDGPNVTLYQGVTLGGTGFQRGKRHPSVGDDVVVGSGAKLLGPIEVGDRSKIGANSVVIHDVPADSTVVGNPGHPVRVNGRRPEGPDADWAHLPDPVADALRALAGACESARGAGGRPDRQAARTGRRDPSAAPPLGQRPGGRVTSKNRLRGR